MKYLLITIRYKIFFSLFLFSSGTNVFVLAQPVPSDMPERVLNLSDCVRIGLQNNQEILILQKELDIAKQRLYQASTFISPRLDFNFNYSYYLADNLFALPSSFGTTILPQRTGLIPGNYYVTRFSIYQDIYTAGRFIGTRGLAQGNLNRVQSQYDLQRNSTVFQVKKAYYELLKQQFRYVHYRTQSETVTKLFAETKKKPVSLEEELRWQDLVNWFTSRVKEIELNINRAKLGLVYAMSIEMNTKVQVQGELKSDSLPTDLDKCLAWAYRFRPELRQIQVQEEMDTLTVRLAVAERYPNIVFGAHYELFGEHLFPLPNKNWSLTVNVNLPLFEGWVGWTKLQQQRIKSDQSRIKKAWWENLVEFEVRQVYNELRYWSEQIELKTQVRNETKIIWDTAKAKLGVKEIDTRDFVELTQRWLIAEDELLNAIVSEVTTRVQLEKSMGKILTE